MKNYDISDEQLASLMEDGMWDMQYDSAPDALCLDDVEVMSVAGRAMQMFPQENVADMPHWLNQRAVGSIPALGMAMSKCCFDLDNADCCFDMDMECGIIPDEDDDSHCDDEK